MATTLHVTPKQMVECWEAFSLNKNVTELNNHTFQAYRTQLIKDADASSAAMTEAAAIQSRNVKREATNMVTPPAPKRQNKGDSTSSVDSVARSNIASPKRKVALPKYNERTKVGEVVASYRPEGVPDMIKKSNSKAGKCVISVDEFETNVQKPYRHMFTTMEERAAALETQLTTLGNEIIQTYGINDGENGIAPLEQINVPRQDKMCVVGRICNEVSHSKDHFVAIHHLGASHF